MHKCHVCGDEMGKGYYTKFVRSGSIEWTHERTYCEPCSENVLGNPPPDIERILMRDIHDELSCRLRILPKGELK